MAQIEVIHLQLFEFMPKYLQLKYIVYMVVSAFFGSRPFPYCEERQRKLYTKICSVIELYIFEYNVKR